MRTKLMSKRTEQQEIAHYGCLYQTYKHAIVFVCKKMLIATKYDYQAYSTEFEGIKYKDNEYHKTKGLETNKGEFVTLLLFWAEM
ncbi:hypothetical protein ECANGB1_2002 [Enterospora canceri]|uniref:Uncharacterized protein n=1 Tax=Enterospora canceri TaxID=1081671 RepID=A0A1Y1S560_9MICR|nr:hypothetical protein ECANGB1_2002 [Enterospora canceri]